jgi:hypothetical protein
MEITALTHQTMLFVERLIQNGQAALQTRSAIKLDLEFIHIYSPGADLFWRLSKSFGGANPNAELK